MQSILWHKIKGYFTTKYLKHQLELVSFSRKQICTFICLIFNKYFIIEKVKCYKIFCVFSCSNRPIVNMASSVPYLGILLCIALQGKNIT